MTEREKTREMSKILKAELILLKVEQQQSELMEAHLLRDAAGRRPTKNVSEDLFIWKSLLATLWEKVSPLLW